jgi:hypothetical protein
MSFVPGDFVGVPCETKPSPFPGEKMVGIITKKGPISGFVRDEDFVRIQGSDYIRGKVVAVRKDTIVVEIQGSYFTTTGLAEFEQIWANQNLKKAA